METLLSILNKTTEFFQKHGLPHARLDAEMLLAHVLGCKRMQLYLDFERPMAEEVLQELRPLLKRRASREPIQYIIGNTGFMDFQLSTDSRALIPRPETEELIEMIVADYRNQTEPVTVLDLGTGSGAIACALARSFPRAQVVATDISERTLELAGENIRKLGLEERVKCIRSNWFDAIAGKFDLIVSNPPYLSDDELKQVEPEVRKYEPSRALTSGNTGMEFIEILLSAAPNYLHPKGTLYLETGCDQRDAILNYARTIGVENQVECLRDLNQKQRFVRYRIP